MSDSAGSGNFLPEAAMLGVRPVLLEICRRLRLGARIIWSDGRPDTLRNGSQWFPISQLSAQLDESAIDRVLADAFRLGQSRLIDLEDVSIAFAPILGSTDGSPNGMFLLAGRRASKGFPELATLASWFAYALTRPEFASAADTEIQRLASLLNILERTAVDDAEPELVRAFVEAMSVWADRESWGLLRDVFGNIALQVALPGTAAADTQSMRHRWVISERERFTVLSFADQTITLTRIDAPGASEWFIATKGSFDEAERDRFLVFCHVLGVALSSRALVDLARLAWSMFDCLATVQASDTFHSDAQNAVSAIRAILGGPASVSVTKQGEPQPLVIGDAASASSPELSLCVPVAPNSLWRATLNLGKPTERPVTRRDQSLAQAASHALGIWLEAEVARPSFAKIWRVCQGMEDCADADGTIMHEPHEPAMIIVTCASSTWGTTEESDNSSSWIAAIHRRLRPDDVVTRLPSGDFGILLSDVRDAGGADAIVRRLQLAIDSDCGPGASVTFSSGHATRLAARVRGGR